jgi:hypothetical protein
MEDEPASKEGVTTNVSSCSIRSYHATSNPLYNDTFFAIAAENSYFQNFTLVVITGNALWIVIDTQFNHYKIYEGTDLTSPSYFFVVESMFVLYFTTEVLIRFIAFKIKQDFYKDGWFVFDTILVLFMILEWVVALIEFTAGPAGVKLPAMSFFRLLRLARLTRMARLMRSFPELMALIKGMKAAFRGAWVIGVFLFGVMFIFSIIFVQQLAASRPDVWLACFPDAPQPREIPPDVVCDDEALERVDMGGDGDLSAYTKFATFGDAMMTLLTHLVLGDNLNQALMFLYAVSPIYHWMGLLVVIISMVTLLNMLIGVLCDVITEAAEAEKNDSQEGKFHDTLTEAFEMLDKSQDGYIQKGEWAQIKTNVKMKHAFYALGIEKSKLDEHLIKLEESLFPDVEPGDDNEVAERGLKIDEFSKTILGLRPATKAAPLDVELIGIGIKKDEVALKDQIKRVEETLLSYGETAKPTNVSNVELQDSDTSRRRKIAKEGWLKTVSNDMLMEVLSRRMGTK